MIGIVGLGIMGGRIAAYLAGAGHQVIGHDIDAAARAGAEASGVSTTAEIAELVASSEILLLSLPSLDAVKATIFAIAAAATAPRVIVEMSTLDLDDKLAVAATASAAGHVLLDCPISGTGAQMATRDCVIYASGAPDQLKRLRPLFDCFARQVFDLGPLGNGTRAKLVANHLVAIHNVATAEAIQLGIASGLDPQVLTAAITAGAGNSRIFELRAPLIAIGSYLPATMRIANWTKDLAAIANLAAGTGAATPLLDAVAPLYAAALDAGLGNLDTAAVALVLAADSRREVDDARC